MFSRKEISIFVICFLLGLFVAWSCILEAGEWNEKPIMCENEIETFDAIN